MRKAKFKSKWIPIKWDKDDNHKKIKGTGCWEDGYSGSGLFHQWANNYEEFDEGPGNYTVALVELEDGTIEEVPPKNIKFDDKLKL